MKHSHIFLIIIVIILCYIISLNAQWYDKSNGLPGYSGQAWAIDAYDSLIATGPYVLTPDYIPDYLYLTTDGGNNWFARKLPNTLEVNDDLIDISIIGKDKIWFCTMGRKAGKIFRTTDGGFNWQLQFYDTTVSSYMNYIEMFDSLNGMAMGDPADSSKPALFLKTTNGGNDWISKNTSYLIGLRSFDIWRGVDFVDMNIGYFYKNNNIYRTINSGENWEVILDTAFCQLLKGYDENILLGEEPNAGDYGTMYRTLDGGQNWESNQYDFLRWGSDIEYIPGNPAYVWYSSLGYYSSPVFFSSDTGKTWVEEFRVDNLVFNDIVFTDENNGWLLANQPGTGRRTRIFRTTNGGQGGIILSVDENSSADMPDEFILMQNFPNPFNPTTNIKYQIPEINFVTLKVYDVLGNEIASLVKEEKPAGSYDVDFNASSLSSGIYFYRLQVGSFVETKKMVLMK